MTDIPRCAWAHSPEMQEYHDREWGVPEHDDRMLFELLTLEGAQAGLSWATILKRRMHYRRVFAEFDICKVADFGAAEVAAALADTGIIRNRLKIHSTISNAQAMIEVQKTHGSFAAYLWHFTDGQQIVTRRNEDVSLPAQTELSERISKALKKLGFRFVGPTIVYSYMQAAGIIDDHYRSCHRALS